MRLIVILLVLFSVLPFVTTQHFYGNELVQFVMFYTIGAYLGKYKDNFFSKKKNSLIVLLASIGVVIVSIICLDLLGLRWPVLGGHSTIFLSRISPASILIAVSVLSIFSQRKAFANKWINIVAGCTLGVYLISDNSYVRNVLWRDILRVPSFVNEPFLILHIIGSVIAVFAVCTVIEYVRQLTLERGFSVVYDRIEAKVRNRSGAKKALKR